MEVKNTVKIFPYPHLLLVRRTHYLMPVVWCGMGGMNVKYIPTGKIDLFINV